MITIKEAKTKKELTEYIKFPFSLYKDNPYWVPPIIADELESFDKTKTLLLTTPKLIFFWLTKTTKLLVVLQQS